ncbi:MAG: pentapeptide repeat-containing protein [Deltaproteobacteria bacterium]|nr:pentapeptide repeat-containing protein [Deltaproteobacteria bacterium]
MAKFDGNGLQLEPNHVLPNISEFTDKINSMVQLTPPEPVKIGDEDDLLEVIKLHAQWLNSLSAPALPVQGKRACFRGLNLAGMSFAEFDLRGADFSGCNLEGASFKDSLLDFADFTNANLRGADMRGTRLTGAITVGADLEGCVAAPA